ncbi:MAG TPA: MraY family glycosyltransferase [Patescibacteria group bacterium]|nr:MraY family glycosyltransferase [Patescibacteria group bacterium]
MNYFLPFLATFLLSAILTGGLWRSGLGMGLLTQPRQRDIHKEPISRLGGLGIFGSFLIVSLIVFLVIKPDLRFSTDLIFGLDSRLWAIWFGGLAITVIMFLDDLYDLSAPEKLLAQISAAILMIGCGIGIDHITNPFGGTINLNSIYVPLFSYGGVVYHFSLWSDLLTLVWIVGMMNVMNFVDGVDGLASGQAAIAALTIFLLSISMAVNQPATAMIAIIVCGASLGFLVWNFPPAKIFMGDSGSMFLGFILGVLALISGGKLATLLLVLGFPIVDGLIVTFSRLRRHQNPLTTPDKTHLHHRFLAAGFSIRQAIMALYVISALFGLIALSSSTRGKVVGFFLLIILILAIMAGLKAVERNRLVKNEK